LGGTSQGDAWLLHSGTVVNADHPDPDIWISGVAASDGSEALYGVTAIRRSVTWPPGRVLLPGLDPDRTYQVQVEPISWSGLAEVSIPVWVLDGLELTGRVLSRYRGHRDPADLSRAQLPAAANGASADS
jgi:alpha-galactosidase